LLHLQGARFLFFGLRHLTNAQAELKAALDVLEKVCLRHCAEVVDGSDCHGQPSQKSFLMPGTPPAPAKALPMPNRSPKALRVTLPWAICPPAFAAPCCWS